MSNVRMLTIWLTSCGNWMRLGVASTPMSFHDCCITVSMLSRCLLPALVIIVNLSFCPPLARMPSEPFAQPALSRSDSAFALSKPMRTCGLFFYAQDVGGSTEMATAPGPKDNAETISCRFKGLKQARPAAHLPAPPHARVLALRAN